MHTLPTWVHGRGFGPLQPPVSLPAAGPAQRVKREIVTEQSKEQKNFNNKIKKEQIKITAEIANGKRHLIEKFKKHVRNLNLTKVRNLQTQIEHLEKIKLT